MCGTEDLISPFYYGTRRKTKLQQTTGLWRTEDLRSMVVLFWRDFNPKEKMFICLSRFLALVLQCSKAAVGLYLEISLQGSASASVPEKTSVPSSIYLCLSSTDYACAYLS